MIHHALGIITMIFGLIFLVIGGTMFFSKDSGSAMPIASSLGGVAGFLGIILLNLGAVIFFW